MPRRRKLPNFLRAAELSQLLTAAAAAIEAARTVAKRRAARRDLVMVQTGLFLGLRVSELVKLRVEQLDLAGGYCQVVAGKGDKDRTLPVPARLLPVLREWVGERKTGWVFTSSSERRLGKRTAQTRITALGVRAGLVRRLKAHGLRHTFATRLLESGAAIHEVSELMGHSSIQTTATYLHCIPERLRSAVDRL